MSGLRIIIDTLFTDETLPYLPADPVLPEDAGALLLIEPGHPAGDGPTGKTANGATYPNIAYRQAVDLIGAGDADTLGATLRMSVNVANGTKGKIERTAKGGLHGIIGRTSIPAATYAVLDAATPILQYLIDNPTHDIYLSTWQRTTRATGAISRIVRRLNAIRATDGHLNLLAAIFSPTDGDAAAPLDTYPNPTTFQAQLIGRSVTPLADTPGGLGAVRASIGAAGWSGTPPTLTSDTQVAVGWGDGGLLRNDFSSGRDVLPSFVFYRLYIEDLTASGRSFATVDALDADEFAANVLTPGGRYYGDTFTDPATIP